MSKDENEKILIITQSKQLAKELKNILSAYNITIVKDSKHAISTLSKDNDYATVLVGIFLKATNGFDFLDYLKNNPEFYDGPVLAICDSITDEVISNTANYNIFDYIVRYSDSLIIKTRIRNAVIYYVEKTKLLRYAVDQVYNNLNDIKLLVNLLAQMMEFKNSESGEHVGHVSIITKFLCKKLKETGIKKYNLPDRDIEYIAIAAALHDIGKLYIPEEVLNKPGKLTTEEYNIMKTHPTLGAEAIDRMPNYKDRPIFKFAYDICLNHHERIDGSGYPNGIKEIPVWAQIVAIADCYDALTSDRVYRKAMSHDGALEAIRLGYCGEFNRTILNCFLENNLKIKELKNNPSYLDTSKETISAIIEDICKIK